MKPEHYDALAWEIFLAKLAEVRVKNLEGEALFSELEQAWAHLFEGCDEDAAREIYAEVMAALLRERIVPPDWAAVG